MAREKCLGSLCRKQRKAELDDTGNPSLSLAALLILYNSQTFPSSVLHERMVEGRKEKREESCSWKEENKLANKKG